MIDVYDPPPSPWEPLATAIRAAVTSDLMGKCVLVVLDPVVWQDSAIVV
jgi:hypothetical protein